MSNITRLICIFFHFLLILPCSIYKFCTKHFHTRYLVEQRLQLYSVYQLIYLFHFHHYQLIYLSQFHFSRFFLHFATFRYCEIIFNIFTLFCFYLIITRRNSAWITMETTIIKNYTQVLNILRQPFWNFVYSLFLFFFCYQLLVFYDYRTPEGS